MKLRKHIIGIAALALLAACGNKQSAASFELTGKLVGGGEGINIYLDRLTVDGTVHLDSVVMGKDGQFTFHTKGITKGFYNLRITNSDYATLILDSNEHVTIQGNSQFLGNTYTVTGSEDSKLFCDMNNVMKMNTAKEDSLKKRFEALVNAGSKDTARMDSLNNAFQKPYDAIVESQHAYVTKFVTEHPTSFACLAAIQQLSPDDFLADYIKIDDALSHTYPNSPYVKMFHDNVAQLKKVAIGAVTPDFSLPDPDGKDVNVADFRGKYLLIDFWASWCGPCRASLPGIVKVYDKYKDKNFTILSVSLDKDKDHWLAAIKHFGLVWTNVSDLQYWDSKVVKLYGFEGIPFSVLVSPDGHIIAKGLEPEQLDAKLDSLVNNKMPATASAATGATYRCPTCTYSSDKPGDCPNDKITLVKVGDYYCPDCYMSSAEPGKCKMCGVEMKKMEPATASK